MRDDIYVDIHIHRGAAVVCSIDLLFDDNPPLDATPRKHRHRAEFTALRLRPEIGSPQKKPIYIEIPPSNHPPS